MWILTALPAVASAKGGAACATMRLEFHMAVFDAEMDVLTTIGFGGGASADDGSRLMECSIATIF